MAALRWHPHVQPPRRCGGVERAAPHRIHLRAHKGSAHALAPRVSTPHRITHLLRGLRIRAARSTQAAQSRGRWQRRRARARRTQPGPRCGRCAAICIAAKRARRAPRHSGVLTASAAPAARSRRPRGRRAGAARAGSAVHSPPHRRPPTRMATCSPRRASCKPPWMPTWHAASCKAPASVRGARRGSMQRSPPAAPRPTACAARAAWSTPCPARGCEGATACA